MNYTRLGRTGLQVSRICLGTLTFGWSADEATSFDIMNAAVDAGINFLDTADMYSRAEGNQGGESETIIGKWLQTQNRREVIIATKVRAQMWSGVNGAGLSRHHILHAVEDSLRRLQTDYIDLYQTHWPDDETPLEETLYALDSLVQSGKVRYIGCSNYPAWLLMKSAWVSDVQRIARFESIQPHYSLFHRSEYELELSEACADLNIGVIPYSPLAAGFATGKYTRENTNPDSTRSKSSIIRRLTSKDAAWDALDVLRRIAQEHNAPVGQIALAWMLQQATVTSLIIGARRVDQLQDIVGAVDIQLSDNDMQKLNAATRDF